MGEPGPVGQRRAVQSAPRGALVAGLLVSGTLTSLSAKSLFQLHGHVGDGQDKAFAKPLFATTLMFTGMALCLLLVPLFQRLEAWLALQTVRIASNLHLQQPLLVSQQQEGPLDLTKPLFESPSDLDVRGAGHRAARSFVLIIVPTCFDIVATLLKKVGLLFLLASVYQMMRSTEIIFAACLSVPLLRRPLDRNQLGGISLCLAGVALVGWASVLDSHPKAHGVSPTQTIVGIALVVAGEAIQAVQNVAEDAFMTNLHLAPIRLVGFEGVYGLLAMVLVVLPLAQVAPGPEGRGLHEDTRETLAMLAGSPQLRAVAACYVACAAVYNLFGMLATNALGAVPRTMLESVRTLGVWLASLALFYWLPRNVAHLGERWAAHSWMQAFGFAAAALGNLIYSRGEETHYARLMVAARKRLAQALRLLRGRPAMRHARIAAGARIRTAYVQHPQAHRLLDLGLDLDLGASSGAEGGGATA